MSIKRFKDILLEGEITKILGIERESITLEEFINSLRGSKSYYIKEFFEVYNDPKNRDKERTAFDYFIGDCPTQNEISDCGYLVIDNYNITNERGREMSTIFKRISDDKHFKMIGLIDNAFRTSLSHTLNEVYQKKIVKTIWE